MVWHGGVMRRAISLETTGSKGKSMKEPARMNRILGLQISLMLTISISCAPLGTRTPYTTIITNPEETRRFLKFEGIGFDDIWIPRAKDIDGLNAALKTYLDSDTPIRTRTWMDREYVLRNIARYNREYSGFTKDGAKYIICQMLRDYIPITQPPKEFTIIMDGGCGIVRVIFDVETKTIVSIDCNGMA